MSFQVCHVFNSARYSFKICFSRRFWIVEPFAALLCIEVFGGPLLQLPPEAEATFGCDVCVTGGIAGGGGGTHQ